MPGFAPVFDAKFVPVALLIMVNLQDTVGVTVEIGIDGLLVPVDSEGIEAVGEGARARGLLRLGFSELVCEIVRPPMQGGSKRFGSSSILLRVVDVAPAFHNIDFIASWQNAVFIVPGQHPDGWPEPIALGQFISYLHPYVFDLEGINGSQFSTHNGVDIVVAVARPAATVKIVSGALVGH